MSRAAPRAALAPAAPGVPRTEAAFAVDVASMLGNAAGPYHVVGVSENGRFCAVSSENHRSEVVNRGALLDISGAAPVRVRAYDGRYTGARISNDGARVVLRNRNVDSKAFRFSDSIVLADLAAAPGEPGTARVELGGKGTGRQLVALSGNLELFATMSGGERGRERVLEIWRADAHPLWRGYASERCLAKIDFSRARPRLVKFCRNNTRLLVLMADEGGAAGAGAGGVLRLYDVQAAARQLAPLPTRADDADAVEPPSTSNLAYPHMRSARATPDALREYAGQKERYNTIKSVHDAWFARSKTRFLANNAARAASFAAAPRIMQSVERALPRNLAVGNYWMSADGAEAVFYGETAACRCEIGDGNIVVGLVTTLLALGKAGLYALGGDYAPLVMEASDEDVVFMTNGSASAAAMAAGAADGLYRMTYNDADDTTRCEIAEGIVAPAAASAASTALAEPNRYYGSGSGIAWVVVPLGLMLLPVFLLGLTVYGGVKGGRGIYRKTGRRAMHARRLDEALGVVKGARYSSVKIGLDGGVLVATRGRELIVWRIRTRPDVFYAGATSAGAVPTSYAEARALGAEACEQCGAEATVMEAARLERKFCSSACQAARHGVLAAGIASGWAEWDGADSADE